MVLLGGRRESTPSYKDNQMPAGDSTYLWLLLIEVLQGSSNVNTFSVQGQCKFFIFKISLNRQLQGNQSGRRYKYYRYKIFSLFLKLSRT